MTTYKPMQQTKAGSINLKHEWLKDRLGVTSTDDIILEIPVPGAQAVLLVRLNPDKPIAQTVKEILGKRAVELKKSEIMEK